MRQRSSFVWISREAMRPLVSGINLFFATAVMTINLFIDILYGYLDPRVQYR